MEPGAGGWTASAQSGPVLRAAGGMRHAGPGRGLQSLSLDGRFRHRLGCLLSADRCNRRPALKFQ